MKKKYTSIQILRGVLFLSILAFHCGIPFASLGWGGVEVFFVISAFFLVKKQYGNESIKPINSFIKRIKRLYPPYIVVLLLATLYALLRKMIPYDLLICLFSAQNYLWMFSGYSSPMQPIIAHTWTLSIEVWSGLFLLFLIKFVPTKKLRVAMLFVGMLGILWRTISIVLGANAWIVSLCPIAHFDAFALGALLAIDNAEGVLTRKKYLLYIEIVLGSIGLVTSVLFLAKRNGTSIIDGYISLSSSVNYLWNWFTGNIYLFISVIASGSVGLLILYDERKLENNTKGCFSLLGDYSYSLYLFHWPILVVLKHFVSKWVITFPTIFVASLVASVVFNKLYSALKKRIGGGKTFDTTI